MLHHVRRLMPCAISSINTSFVRPSDVGGACARAPERIHRESLTDAPRSSPAWDPSQHGPTLVAAGPFPMNAAILSATREQRTSGALVHNRHAPPQDADLPRRARNTSAMIPRIWGSIRKRSLRIFKCHTERPSLKAPSSG